MIGVRTNRRQALERNNVHAAQIMRLPRHAGEYDQQPYLALRFGVSYNSCDNYVF
jgi:hypothetical protein